MKDKKIIKLIEKSGMYFDFYDWKKEEIKDVVLAFRLGMKQGVKEHQKKALKQLFDECDNPKECDHLWAYHTTDNCGL